MLLHDRTSGFNHYLFNIDELAERLMRQSSLGIITVSISGLDAIEESRGPQIYDNILGHLSQTLLKIKGNVIRDTDIITMAEIGAPIFHVFLSCDRSQGCGPKGLAKEQVQNIVHRIEDMLYPEICRLTLPFMKEAPVLALGHALIVNNPLIRPRRLIYRLMEESKQMARLQLPLNKFRNKDRLQEIILKEDITTLFHPIVDLKTGHMMGYEGLTRGPKGSIFEFPLSMFSIAKDVGLIFELDRICRRKALSASCALPQDAKVFVNSLPNTIHDPEFRGQGLTNFLESSHLRPENIVFEINERVAIDNFPSFKEAAKYYTDAGMSIAIDDTGTGYSTLEAIVELSPHYLKFDISMVNGLHKNTLKQEMLRMLTHLADKINAIIIAEGIEEKEDLEMLQAMGIPYGQGFYFCKPLTVEEIANRGPTFDVG